MSTETIQATVIITSIVAIIIFAIIMHIRMERKYNREMTELYKDYVNATEEIEQLFNLNRFKDEEE